VIASNDPSLREKFMNHIQSKFPITDFGTLKWFLGIAYKRLQDGSLLAMQEAYIEKYLDKLGLSNLKRHKVPMESTFKVYESDLCKNPSAEMVQKYREKIGGLLWLQTWTRPHIS
jgi:hypothetical protein